MSEGRFAEMISKIGHELRSPLTSVKGFSATLLSRWDRFSDEQKYQLVETIHADAERMGRIISEVLDLARLESNRLELHLTNEEIEPLVTGCLEHLKAHAGAARVSVDLASGLTARIDRERFSHVLSNLLENAIKFSEDGPIHVSGREVDAMVEVKISDEGIGIAAERLPGLFDGVAPQGQMATPLGTGLGLYLSRRLVEAHGGTVSAESEEGKGSTFYVRVPAGSGS